MNTHDDNTERPTPHVIPHGMTQHLSVCVVVMLLTLLPLSSHGAERADTALLHRVFRYASTVDTTGLEGHSTYAYNRFSIDIDHKNAMLMLVPSLYVVAHGHNRHYISETFTHNVFHGKRYDTEVLLHTTTIPHKRRALGRVLSYLYPNIYAPTIVDDYLLSPFHSDNRRFYRYHVTFLLNGTARITFHPKRNNTQLLRGEALVDYYSGRVINCQFRGEYDLISFTLDITPGEQGLATLLPHTCKTTTRFSLLGNKVTAHAKAYYDQPAPPVDTISKKDDYPLLASLRPDTLSSQEQGLYTTMFAQQYKKDSLALAQAGKPKRKDFVKDVLWDAIGDNMLNKINSSFGVNNQGYIRLNPVLNPLYMSYDHSRGFTYKIDLRANYQFSEQKELSMRLKGGYAFKQKQFYWRVPLYYYFHKRKNAYVKLEVGNGNRIRSHSVRDDIEQQFPDSTHGNPLFDRLNEFRQTDARLMMNYDANSRFGLQLGVLYQQRTAIDGKTFHDLGWTDTYRSFAPVVQLQYRPLGWAGPIFTVDYDRSFRNVMRSNTEYERWEMNAEYIYHLNRLQSWQTRFGMGLYTRKDPRAYFLNYENFSENNIPGGWNDDWSGQFELLRSDTYNNSDYYFRLNVTYESPLLLLSWLPWAGHYMEMERIYVSALEARHVHPYLEVGYGFTTRLVSIGLFASNGHGNRVVGCKFGFELFRHW